DGVRAMEKTNEFSERTPDLYIVHERAPGGGPQTGTGVVPKKRQGGSPNGDGGSHQEGLVSRPTRTNPTRTSKGRPLTEDWRPTAQQWSKLEQKHGGKDIDAELEKFRDWHIEKKSQYKDWNRAFDNCLKRARPSKPRQKLF